MFDHHRVAFAKITKHVGPGKTVFKFPEKAMKRTSGIHLHAGEYDDWYVLGDVAAEIYVYRETSTGKKAAGSQH